MDFNPVIFAIPIYVLLISFELIYVLIKKANSYYRISDAVTNIACGLGDQLIGVFAKAVTVGIYIYVYNNFKFFDFEFFSFQSPKSTAILTFAIGFVAVDFLYYWNHRLSHEMNFLWAGHVVHHQSEDYNLSVALRQSWFHKFFNFIFYLPLAFLGFDPELFIISFGFNLIYQFWIHTEVIGKMGFFGWIMNTPSHHRVHHGRNPKYIDKNHAGVFIIWDKFFGTFKAEEEKPVYGITTPVKSWNPLWVNVLPWITVMNEVLLMNSFTNKVKIFFKPPGWRPKSMGGTLQVPQVDNQNHLKYKVANPRPLNLYLIFQFVIAIVGTAAFLYNQQGIDNFYLELGAAFFLFFAMVSLGILFERKRWAYYLEYIRLISTLLFGSFLFKEHLSFQYFLFSASAITFVSLLWLIIMSRIFKR